MIDVLAARELAHRSDDVAMDPTVRRLIMSIDEEYSGICSEPRTLGQAAANLQQALDQTTPVDPPAPARTLTEWAEVVHKYARDKGWWDSPRNIGDIFMLITSEVAEAYEEYRNNHEVTETYFNDDAPTKPEGVPSELADVLIRILDFCCQAGIDIQGSMEQKHAYNLTRPYRHGGKRT